ncbi:MAG: hypothetical protein RLZZ403_1762 [Pseudomonadota bacterium]
MSTPGDDQDLDEFLSGQSDLSRHYRSSRPQGAREEPPPDLDRAILAQARAAVAAPAATVTPLPIRKRLQWAVPFALAASVLLTVAIFREAGEEVGVNGNVTTGVLKEQSVAPASTPAIVATVPESIEEDRAEAVAVTRDDVAQKPAELRAAAPVVAASPPPVAVPVPSADLSRVAAAPAANESVAAAPGSVAPVPPAAPPAGAVVAARAPAAQRASAEAARTEAEPAGPQRTPERWLEDVRRLRAAGQGAAADDELKRFLEAYPDYFTRNPGVARP